MPQESYPYAVSRVRCLETHMLDSAKLARLKEADTAEAYKLLQESGYAAVDGDIEPAILSTLAEARKTVWEITPAPEVTGLFLLKTDAHNIKALLKARLLGIEAADVLAEGGLFPLEKIQKAVLDKDYRDLPQAFKEALVQIEAAVLHESDPGALSAAVDRAVFHYIQAVLKKHKNKFAKRYFAAEADFINVTSVVRARAMGYDIDQLLPMLVEGGEIPRGDLVEALSLPSDQIARKLARGAHGHAIAAALDEYAQNGSAQALSAHMDAALMELVREGKRDSFGLGPIVGYLLGREAEAKALRVLFAAKRAGMESALPELYA